MLLDDTKFLTISVLVLSTYYKESHVVANMTRGV